MQYSIATAISTILFASTLTSAAAIPQQATTIAEVNLQLSGGNGDDTYGRSIARKDFGKILTKDSDGQDLEGVALGTSTAGVTCAIFDSKTLVPFGGNNALTFTSESDKAAFGLNGADGGTGSKLEDIIAVATCCDFSNKFASTCLKSQEGSGKGSNNAGNGGAAGSEQKFLPVEMLLSGLNELAVPATVIADGNAHPVRNAVGIQKIHITKQHTKVECKAFKDEAGKQQVGNMFNVIKNGVDFVDFKLDAGVDVNSVACRKITA